MKYLFLIGLFLSNFSYAEETIVECSDSLNRYVIKDFKLIDTHDHIFTYENGGLANLKFIDTLNRSVTNLFCGIYEDEDLSSSNRINVRDRLKIACIANHLERGNNIRLRIEKKLNRSFFYLGIIQIENKDDRATIDTIIPVTCKIHKSTRDSCYDECGRSCFETPIFCGQW